jgi:hypothetical protein
VAIESIYHRLKSPTQSAQVAKKQIASQEMWGGPNGNHMNGETPYVMAFYGQLPGATEVRNAEKGIEFSTDVAPDRNGHPWMAFWSGPRDGIRVEDGYAKIKVTVLFCNQLEEVYDRR